MTTPEIKNIGNAFINSGGINLIKKSLPKNSEVHYIEALETSGNLFNYPTKAVSIYNKKLVENCDWLIVLGGSCLSRYMIGLFEEVKQLKVKKILLGAGFYEGIEKELPMYKDLPEYFDWIFVRDKESFKALRQGGKYINIVNGLDMGFWLNMDEYKIDGVEKYSVVNIDSPERGELQKRLTAKHKNAIISRNNSMFTHICNSDLGKNYNCFVAEKWFEYIRLYTNAEFVATNRVHTFLACIMADTPCQPFLDYTAAYERFFLFKQIGLEIEPAKVYTKKDYDVYKKKMETEKFRVEHVLSLVFQNLII